MTILPTLVVLKLTQVLNHRIVSRAIKGHHRGLTIKRVIKRVHPTRRIPTAANTTRINSTPRRTLGTVNATQGVGARTALRPHLNRHVMQIMHVHVLRDQRLGEINIVDALRNLLHGATRLNRLTILMRNVTHIKGLTTTVGHVLRRTMFFKIMIMNLLRGQSRQPAAIRLMVARHIVTITVQGTLIVITVTLMLNGMLRLKNRIGGQGTLSQPRRTQRKLLNVRALVSVNHVQNGTQYKLLNNDKYKYNGNTGQGHRHRTHSGDEVLKLRGVLPTLI